MSKGMKKDRRKSMPMRRRALEAACVAVAVMALSLGAAACGGAGDDKSSSSAKDPDINAQGEGELNIVNWEGYTDPSFVKGFEKETGCKVNDTFAGTSDEMFTKSVAGGGAQAVVLVFSGGPSLRAI